jgi:hypothetical protein
MSNGLRIRGVSGDVSSVSVQSSVNQTWALLGRKWAGLRWRVHEVSLQRDEVAVLKCHGGACVLELTALGNEHGDTIVQEGVSRIRLGLGQKQHFRLSQGQALVLTTPAIQHPYKRLGPVIET